MNILKNNGTYYYIYIVSGYRVSNQDNYIMFLEDRAAAPFPPVSPPSPAPSP